MKFIKAALGSTLIAILVFSGVMVASAETHKLTLAYLPVKGTTYVEYSEIFADRVKKATGGRVQIILNDSLVKGTQLFQSVRDDRVQMATVLGGYYSATNPQIGLQQLPGLMDNLSEFNKVFYGFWRSDMNKLFAKKYNCRVLWWGLFCPQNLISIKPINTLADFKGKKIRVHNIETATLVAAIGAKPTPMPASEVLPALQRRIIDGVFTSSCWAYGQAFYSVAKYVSLWPVATILPFPVVINQQEWKKLPADLQKIITEVSQKTEQDAFANYQGTIENFPKKWAAKGVKYSIAPEAQVKLMFQPKNIKPVYKAFFERAQKAGFDGEAYVQKALKILNKKVDY